MSRPRIIAGSLKNRVLRANPGKNVRPTAGRTRESIFTLISPHASLENAHVMDIFCGTGALGIEALSRGAGHITFVDIDPRPVQENIQALNLQAHSTIIRADIRRLKVKEPADIIFIDPPYNQGLAATALGRAEDLGREGTLWVVETEAGRTGTPLAQCGPFTEIASRTYGAACITLLKQRTG